MADTPNKNSVPLDTAFVKQHHRMAAGLPVNGQKQPEAPKPQKSQA